MKSIYGAGAVFFTLIAAVFFSADLYVRNIDSSVERDLAASQQSNVENHPKVTKSVTDYSGILYGGYGPDSIVSTSNLKNSFRNNRKSEPVRSLIFRTGEIEIWEQKITTDPPAGVKIVKPELRKYPIEPFFRKSLDSEG